MKNAIFILLLLPAALYAQDSVNEDQLFSDTDNVVQSDRYRDSSIDSAQDKKSVSISGGITSVFSYTKIDESPNQSPAESEELNPYILGDLYFDARLPGGYKGFSSFELRYDASQKEETGDSSSTEFSVQEIFVDFNIMKHAYFRTGKQVLQWGRCYLWNPTDLINIERKTFVEKIGSTEGTYGIKGHVPFGTVVNIYGFADFNEAEKAEDVAGAGKFEFLVKETEMAFSVWGKKSYHPVYGYDISSRLLGIDIKGEASYSHGSNTETIKSSGPLLYSEKSDDDIYKASINLGRDFGWGDKSKKITASVEFYYNGDGYSGNPLADDSIYIYDVPVEFDDNGTIVTIPGGEAKTYLAGHSLYTLNNLSKYYAALFTTINEFITSDYSLSFNLISNIQQKSYIVSCGLNYTNINDFRAGITANISLGSEDGEYRAAGTEHNIQATAGIIF